MSVKKPLSMLRFLGYTVLAFLVLGAIGTCAQRKADSVSPAERQAREQVRAEKAAQELAAEARKVAEKKARDQEKTCKDDVTAYVMSQSFVKKRLKSPATADFPTMGGDSVRTSYKGSCIHEVLAYVDSQNSFGAMLRMKYYAKLQYDASQDGWKLLELKTDQ